MQASKAFDYQALYGDIHNHCNISYAHGSLDDAIKNAALRLDFASITGHASWPDMDEHDPRIQHIVQFHQRGFAKLHKNWDNYLERISKAETAHQIVLFPGYEIHSNEHGDYTIVGLKPSTKMILEDSPQELRQRIFKENLEEEYLIFPHHIGYRQGARGVNWNSFENPLTPLVEIASAHGFAEEDLSDRPFLHSMGPQQHQGSMRYGLGLGHQFGVIANTDHHSAHPGSYGHGVTGIWAHSDRREGIWEALHAKRTWAMTGDLMQLKFVVGNQLQGSICPDLGEPGKIEVQSTSPIDYIELLTPEQRQCWHMPMISERKMAEEFEGTEEAIVWIELGWGERGKAVNWDVSLELERATILEVIPRFRGFEVVSPLDKRTTEVPIQHANWEQLNESSVDFHCGTWGNTTNSTSSTQGLALRITKKSSAKLRVRMNQESLNLPIQALTKGSISGNLGPIDSPAYRIGLSLPSQYSREVAFQLDSKCFEKCEYQWAYARVRLKNGHWGISSPVFIN
ncbi:MAG: DUF3604 domain-containing protein [Deltaproteobacteria bacterium]